MATQKNWWAPLWRGLVVDAEAKHYRRMKNALWLYLYLILHADRRTGTLKRKCGTISSDMGLSEKTLRKWIPILRTHGYIETGTNGRCTEFVINKWKTLPHSSGTGSQTDTNAAMRIPKPGQAGVAKKTPKALAGEEKRTSLANRNDIPIKKKI